MPLDWAAISNATVGPELFSGRLCVLLSQHKCAAHVQYFIKLKIILLRNGSNGMTARARSRRRTMNGQLPPESNVNKNSKVGEMLPTPGSALKR